MKRSGLQRKTPLKSKSQLKAKAPMKRSASKPKTQKPKMTPIRKAARGQPCTVRAPGHCDGGGETTVLAHLNGGGMGAKMADAHAAFACAGCHSFLDFGYVQEGVSRDERDLIHLRAVIETQSKLLQSGLLVEAKTKESVCDTQ